MATFTNYFRAYTEDGGVMVVKNGVTTAATQLYSKTVKVSVQAQGSPAITDVKTAILDAAVLGTTVPLTGRGKTYLYLELQKRSSALAATDAVTAIVTNAASATAIIDSATYHTLLNVGDNVIIPWQVLTTDTDADRTFSLDLGMSVAAASGKYFEVYVSVYYTR